MRINRSCNGVTVFKGVGWEGEKFNPFTLGVRDFSCTAVSGFVEVFSFVAIFVLEFRTDKAGIKL